MSATIPPVYTPILDQEVDVETPVTEETVRKFLQNINFLSALAPIGTVIANALNIPNNPTPNVELFQYCDGAEITNVDSPLKSTGLSTRTTVNMQGLFIRGAGAQTTNNIVGTAAVNFQHDHGGSTQGHSQSLDPQSGSDWAGGDTTHAHAMNVDLGVPGGAGANPDYDTGRTDGLTTIDPYHYNVAFFLKIN